MAKDKKQAHDPKESALKADRSLNPHPERVRSKAFKNNPFFDSRDMVQIKYEMLREVEHDGTSVSRAAEEFGFSRPFFYQAKADFEAGGIPGLAGQKRGPKRAHKISGEVLAYIESETTRTGKLDAVSLSASIEQKFKVKIHPRSIERALERKKKRHHP